MRNGGADEDDTILAIEGTIIKQVTETKFLGVTIVDQLQEKTEIQEKYKLILHFIIFVKLYNYRPTEVFLIKLNLLKQFSCMSNS